MEKQPLLSVIVPIYRVEVYLDKCIKSISEQTYTNLEIILVNDGSDDECYYICEKWKTIDTRIVVIHKENEGLVKARKVGLSVATGEYIGYVDGDDWIEKDMYEKLMEKVVGYECDIVASGRIEEYETSSKVCSNQIPEGQYTGVALRENVISKMLSSYDGKLFNLYPTVWDKVFKKEILQLAQMNVPDIINTGEDVACVYPAILMAKSIYIINQCFYHYNRKRIGSMLASRDKMYFDRMHVLKEYLEEQFKKSEHYDVLRVQLNNYIWDLGVNGICKEYQVQPISHIKKQYLFPYELIMPKSKIVLYGAGKVGKELFSQIKYNHYCNIISWIDKEGETLGVDSIDTVKKIDFDYVVIAVLKKQDVDEIIEQLKLYNVASKKIIWKDYRF